MNPAPTLLLLLACLRATGTPTTGASETPARPILTGRAVTLVELRAAPGRFLGEEVRFTLQFQKPIEGWNPYLSRFEPGTWLGFAAWADETFTWDTAVFEDPAQHLFVRRGGALEGLLGRAHTYRRFEAQAIVRETFLGEPWIEVRELTPLEDEVGEGTILHVDRARELVFQGRYELALEQYDRARAAPLPPHALAAILKEILETKEIQELSQAEERQKVRQKSEAKNEPKSETRE